MPRPAFPKKSQPTKQKKTPSTSPNFAQKWLGAKVRYELNPTWIGIVTSVNPSRQVITVFGEEFADNQLTILCNACVGSGVSSQREKCFACKGSGIQS